MQSKRLVRFYDEHCSRTITQIADCENTLNMLNDKLQDIFEQSSEMQQQQKQLWQDYLGATLTQKDLYLLKRKEALILSYYEELQLQVQETKLFIEESLETRNQLYKLRLHYGKKKNKWEWMSERDRKLRIRKDIHKDGQAAEECVTWINQ